MGIYGHCFFQWLIALWPSWEALLLMGISPTFHEQEWMKVVKVIDAGNCMEQERHQLFEIKDVPGGLSDFLP